MTSSSSFSEHFNNVSSDFPLLSTISWCFKRRQKSVFSPISIIFLCFLISSKHFDNSSSSDLLAVSSTSWSFDDITAFPHSFFFLIHHPRFFDVVWLPLFEIVQTFENIPLPSSASYENLFCFIIVFSFVSHRK
jgi:hypothetical protein